ncbi:MAG: ABC transporter permease [Dehalobacterium sp.]
MKGQLGKKISEYLVTVIVIFGVNFFLPRLMPGDPFLFLSSDAGSVTVTFSQEQIEKYQAYYGLDQPLERQFAAYGSKLFQGDLGYSIYFNDKVMKIILARLPWTLALVLISLVLSSVIGVILGSLSAWYRNSYLDRATYFFMICFGEIPSFLIGIFFLFFVAAKTGLFPLAGGISSFAVFDSPGAKIADLAHHAFLPVLTLALARMGEFYLLSRNSMITVLSKDYMRTARAKGLGRLRIIFCHALKNALLPVVTRIFLSLGTVFGGAILVENVFNYPGIGRLMQQAVLFRDYVLIQGIFLFVAVTVLTMNLVADLVYKRLDPRVG